MIAKFVSRVRAQGLVRTLKQYEDALARQMSRNYKQNPQRFREMPFVRRQLTLVFDYVRTLVDKAFKALDHALTDQRGIPMEELEEFDVRMVDSKRLNQDSIVYAFGVSGHIETEEQLAQAIGCTVHMFDPTPPALAFMETRVPDAKLPFDPIGVWTKSGPMRFYVDRRPEVKNLSVVNMYHTDSYIEAPCLTLQDIMKRKGHERIDLLKMDIEGSALPVVLHMLTDTDLRPDQIVCSLERPHFVFNASFSEVLHYLSQKMKLYKTLRDAGYRLVTYSVGDFTALRLPQEA